MKKEAVIFGAGEWGRVAYYYYKDSCEIICYVDNDEKIWNTQMNNIPICSPEILKGQQYTVIIANKRYEAEIKQQLLCDYDIRGVVLFRIDERMEELYYEDADICQSKEEELIVAFSHGLGNQMFQYALYRNFVKLGKHVMADLSAYNKPDMMPFELLDVFPNIQLELCNPSKKANYLSEGKQRIYIESPPHETGKGFYKKELLEMEFGYIEGFHCSYKYPNLIRQELMEDFVFLYQNDSMLLHLKKEIEQKEVVSVHIRRGDFLNSKYWREIGNICTEEYYKKAIDYIKNIRRDAVFCFFSNDIEWVKDNLKEEGALYIEKDMFDQYCNWYDMYLMSICKHNIIPNSTFGWWGAWLNQNSNKIVIAPKKWRNRWEANDWCPPEWILI